MKSDKRGKLVDKAVARHKADNQSGTYYMDRIKGKNKPEFMNKHKEHCEMLEKRANEHYNLAQRFYAEKGADELKLREAIAQERMFQEATAITALFKLMFKEELEDERK